VTASWITAGTEMTAKEQNVPSEDFTPDALPAVTVPIYPGLE